MAITKKEREGTPYLRRLQQPLYDTNVIDASDGTFNILQFFVRPIGQPMPVAGGAKSIADTNMRSASQLGNPLEFDLIGFNFEYFNLEPESEDGGDPLDIAADSVLIYGQSVFRFQFNQRTYLEVPLRQIPEGLSLTGTLASGDTSNAIQFAYLHWGESSVKQMYNFVTYNKPLKINTGQPFSAEVEWPNAAIDMNTNNDERYRCYLQGILYNDI